MSEPAPNLVPNLAPNAALGLAPDLAPPVTPPEAPPRRRILDVSELPNCAFDWRDPVWWGNTLLIIIETVTIALVVIAYFYIRRNFDVFPPPKVDVSPPIYNTAPILTWGTANLILMVVSLVPMYITDQSSRRQRTLPTAIGLALMLAVAIITCALRWREFQSVYFWWNDNAYASCVWVMLGTHLTYLLAASVEFAVMLIWIASKGLDEHHALDVTLCGGYWYWTTAVYAIVYVVIYWTPRF